MFLYTSSKHDYLIYNARLDINTKAVKKASNNGLVALVIAAIAITDGIIVYGISQFGLVG
ncbi:hypothetical protein [Nostoc sp. NMS4]|uniref:hypothetical protein n=1 Tax=Nostoc sp. NMS4 TaxID=2815390 RepID=UPI0025FA52D6|nr:hypothetical protein [Nostoc sp. NMS4]MBN3927782.1 hypothetical protein [Nostoc sp. NMS4]